MVRIGYCYEETRLDGGHSVLAIWGASSRAEADAAALRNGWKQPRWWQWWRWQDQPRTVEPLPHHALPVPQQEADRG